MRSLPNGGQLPVPALTPVLPRPVGDSGSAPGARPRLLSEADGHEIAQRLARFADGGGYTTASIVSTWRGNVRWARNQISTSGEDRNDHVVVERNIRGAQNSLRQNVEINETTDAALMAAVRRAERLARLHDEDPEWDLVTHYAPEPCTTPSLFSETTYQLDAGHRAAAAHELAQSAVAAGMLSAGYIEVEAVSLALITSYGYAQYFQYTWAQYSVTVRDPKGIGSGWAGVDWPDWSKIDGPALSALALEKCLQSRNPVAIEPGRYTTILEPQAVSEFVGQLFYGEDRRNNEGQLSSAFGAFQNRPGYSQLGEPVVDERITISADPLDPELGFPPWTLVPFSYKISPTFMQVYHPATWIERGVLTALPYNREYGVRMLGLNTGLPISGSFRMSGGETSIAEMIATTTRGLLVTRFDQVYMLETKSKLMTGITRDGVWLIEHGKISKPVKNMVFTESILFALNNLEQLGVPQRVFCPPYPYVWINPSARIVPPLKIRDFSFTALDDAI